MANLPIIVVEGFDVSLHSSISDAENWLEPWWVRQNEGLIYDAGGHRLTTVVLEIKEPHLFGTKVREKVQILTGASDVDASDELRSALIAHLKAAGKIQDSIALESASLEYLISLSEDK